jgi:dihydrofolate reductase
MRKIVAGLMMSLDGVTEKPSNWAGPYFTDDMFSGMAEGVGPADAVLIGRNTYQEFIPLWAHQGSTSPMAAFLNETHKYVVSSTLHTLDWGPASLIDNDLAGQLAKLKEQPGGNIQVPGSPALVRWLLGEGLLDELALYIFPIALGSGTRLFDGLSTTVRLTAVDSVTFSTGVLGVTYRTALS